jgi:chromosome segregation ATPase
LIWRRIRDVGVSNALISSIVTGLLGSGFAGVVVQLYHARTTRKELDLKAKKQPVEIEQVVLGGASQAVTLLTGSLQWAEQELAELRSDQASDRREIRRLSESVEAKDARIRELESELLILKERFGQVQIQLERALSQVQELKENGNGNGNTVVQ